MLYPNWVSRAQSRRTWSSLDSPPLGRSDKNDCLRFTARARCSASLFASSRRVIRPRALLWIRVAAVSTTSSLLPNASATLLSRSLSERLGESGRIRSSNVPNHSRRLWISPSLGEIVGGTFWLWVRIFWLWLPWRQPPCSIFSVVLSSSGNLQVLTQRPHTFLPFLSVFLWHL